MVLLVIFLSTGRAEAADVELDGQTISRSAELVGHTTYIPLRELLEHSGEWEISWDSATRTATATGAFFTLAFPTDSDHILLDGAPYTVGRSYLNNGVTYVPLRTVAQLCGFAVQWNGAEQPIQLSPAAQPYDDEDLYWLSHVISAESQGESLLGQLAVGTVVLNRRNSQEFPDTIYDVVFDQKNGVQFEPVSNGTIYLEPTAKSLLAARLCLDGTRVAGESLYFYAPALSQGTWIRENRPYYTTIGCHRFFL